MYPGTFFNWYDQSAINTTDANVIDNSPLFMVVSSFDKGPENFMEISGSEFNSLFGTMSFERHGQNAIQTQRIIDAGGRIFVKRVCAEDATLGNVIFVAHLTTTETQKVDEDGNPIYLDDAGEETTVDTGNPVMISSVSIKWEAVGVTDCTNIEDVKTKALELLDEDAGVYPLLIFTDNGRGESGKSIRLIPDYSTSKTIGSMFYSATVFEGTKVVESVPATFDPETIYSNNSYAISGNLMNQVKCATLVPVYEAYITKIAEALGIDVNVARSYDLIYGYTNKGSSIDGLTIDAESIDLNSEYGIELKQGSNGTFGDKPVNSPAWTEAIRKVYAGEAGDEVWDVDQHKLAAICDANFPITIKEEIARFVNFRKDCVFFRDLGLDLTTFIQINAAYSENTMRNCFIADYCTSYEVKDPGSKRNIKVTMMYDFVECLVAHLATAPYNPLAGTANSFVLKEAIKGTINYTPIITPSVNQKQAMDDIRVNYAIFEDDNCVVQTLYTSQEKYTELSYVNAVLGIQQVARAVRTACPKNRYSMVTNNDLSSYAKAVNTVLSAFSGNFARLEFSYTKDPLKISQKIFYATIKFAFHQWAQTEIFDLYAINIED
jgi:hypothetical protein